MDDSALYAIGLRGTREFGRAVAVNSPGGAVHDLDGVVAAVVPATPERSVVNSVCFEDAERLEAVLPALADLYGSAGVHAWTVWTPREDSRTAAVLEAAGHVLDASPEVMAVELDGLARPAPDALPEWERDADPRLLATLNDRAYGYDRSFERALEDLPPDLMRIYVARLGGEPVSVLGMLDWEDDSYVTLVATLAEARGRGFAGNLLAHALVDASERGLTTSSLVATKLGAGVYERLGFRELGPVDMWERREP